MRVFGLLVYWEEGHRKYYPDARFSVEKTEHLRLRNHNKLVNWVDTICRLQ